eukprot:CAMPEP_0202692226 /NCGR_PEP_ID=MMETSP1385-20130828/6661_1 /ASSEMBLY_ACC=CAM_ASM_000861 /TAXON_ID=933848 /ORGANISM="Elphidium margaritaceum" /LENGTH=171 /DNA_ID=CAMNT_0049347719 /DNA_START=56 /DNA_END=567 /DNA_ORIENTATION=+
MQVARNEYWRRHEESDSDSEDEEDYESEALSTRVSFHTKRLYSFASSWSSWSWGKTKNGVYEICAHTFFVALPFAIIIMQQTLDEQKWEHTLKIATSDIEKKTMQSMGSKMAGMGDISGATANSEMMELSNIEHVLYEFMFADIKFTLSSCPLHYYTSCKYDHDATSLELY